MGSAAKSWRSALKSWGSAAKSWGAAVVSWGSVRSVSVSVSVGACGGIRACSGRNGGACGSGTVGDRTLFMKCVVVSLGSVAKSWGSAAVWVVRVGQK